MSEPGGPSGVTTAAGFSACGVACGIRRSSLDLALVVSDRPASAAAVFTRNLVLAAPIVVSKEALEQSGGQARAVVVNAGNANACTGPAGEASARETARHAAELLGTKPAEVLVASTGVIGQPLPLEKLLAALPVAVEALSPEGGRDAAVAILTTDTHAKESVRRVEGEGGRYAIGGMAKGSGMVHPDMATTLAFLTTDAAVSAELLQPMLRRAIDRSFNRLTIDGDTSTNDMVAVLANGASGFTVAGGAAAARFEQALSDLLVELARAVARDGEGATRLITVRVDGAASEDEALQVARTIASSPLVRTAVHGADANWGRIIAAAGRSGVAFDPERVEIRINGLAVLEPGYLSRFSEEEASARLSEEEVVLAVDLGTGRASATTWTCDLTADYVAINAHYRT
jgi:glutamate N-acetyltransferase/amino-acid N-acetyltransferase